jgi:hypothetical protein
MGLAGGAGHSLNTQRDRLCAIRLHAISLSFRASDISGVCDCGNGWAGVLRFHAGRADSDLDNLGSRRSFERLSYTPDAGPTVHSFNIQSYLAHKSSP